jgi:protein-S-isoprenylcysteine O-methyltransferase Ste14
MEKRKFFFVLGAIIALAIMAFFTMLFDSKPFIKTIFTALVFLAVIYYRRAQLAVFPAETKSREGFDDRLVFFPAYFIFLMVCAYDFWVNPINIPITLFGGLLFIIGIYIYSKSTRELGKFFSTAIEIKQKHELIQTGPYKFVRHPAYFGGLLFMAGLAIGANSLLGFLIFAIVTIPWYAWRIKKEERTLKKEFGKEFEEYKKKTKLLIPKLI